MWGGRSGKSPQSLYTGSASSWRGQGPLPAPPKEPAPSTSSSHPDPQAWPGPEPVGLQSHSPEGCRGRDGPALVQHGKPAGAPAPEGHGRGHGTASVARMTPTAKGGHVTMGPAPTGRALGGRGSGRLRPAQASACQHQVAASLVPEPELHHSGPENGREGQHQKDDSGHPDAIALCPPLGGRLGWDQAGQVQHVAQRPADVGATGLRATRPVRLQAAARSPNPLSP